MSDKELKVLDEIRPHIPEAKREEYEKALEWIQDGIDAGAAEVESLSIRTGLMRLTGIARALQRVR